MKLSLALTLNSVLLPHIFNFQFMSAHGEVVAYKVLLGYIADIYREQKM